MASGVLVTGDCVAGKYEVGAELGRGGMAIVYEAMHVSLGTRVALKVLRPEMTSSPTLVRRFAREARAAASLQSEHVARVLDVGTLDGSESPYIVMECLTGRDLRQELEARGPLPVEVAVDWILQACEAVAEAHARGIVHRDLKLSNLFLARRGDGSQRIKVLDFGIAKAALERTPDVELTGTQDVFGSPRYMSPEQLKATGDVTARSDVWALGVVLYELLSGRPPFPGGSVAEVHAAVLMAPAPPIPREGLPEGLRDAVGRCLQKDAGRRFASVADLARALAPFAAEGTGRRIESIEAWSAPDADRGHVTHPVGELPEDTPHTGITSAIAGPTQVATEASVDPGQQTHTSWDQEADRRRGRRSRWLGAAVVLAVGAALAVAAIPRATPEKAQASFGRAVGSVASAGIAHPAEAAPAEPATADATPPAATASAPRARAGPSRSRPAGAGSAKPPRSTYDVRE